ncbi:DUF4365 domain-containing protein [Micromonospora sp. NPDC049102]|uniref:DUF4365 domain-containing protein n=1 Tax=Micromonospora sp. NPDC049102 TaxID=3364265 RepID=UPI00371D1D3F
MALTDSSFDETAGSAHWLPENQVKARYGVTYVAAICSQAGVGFKEWPPDEDFLAIDADVRLRRGSVSVQVKCTSRFKIRGYSASWPAEVSWRRAWSECYNPVYFVLVIVDLPDPAGWLIHTDDGTHHRAAAFWARVDNMSDVGDIKIPKDQRLTTETLSQWAADLRDCYIPERRESER